MLHHTGRDELGRRVHDAADDALGGNLRADESARIDVFHHAPGKLAAVLVEVPVRDAVLHRDDDRLRSEQHRHIVRDRLDLVRLHRQNHDVMRTGVGIVVRRPHLARDVFTTVVHHELDAVAANRLEIRATYDECDVLACERELRADIAADGTCSNDRDLH